MPDPRLHVIPEPLGTEKRSRKKKKSFGRFDKTYEIRCNYLPEREPLGLERGTAKTGKVDSYCMIHTWIYRRICLALWHHQVIRFVSEIRHSGRRNKTEELGLIRRRRDFDQDVKYERIPNYPV